MRKRLWLEPLHLGDDGAAHAVGDHLQNAVVVDAVVLAANDLDKEDTGALVDNRQLQWRLSYAVL